MTMHSLESIAKDLRYALRGFARSPGFTATVILSLSLGIGASLAIFTVADNLLLRPLPYRDATRLVMVWEANPPHHVERNPASPGNYLDWKSQNHVFESMAAFRNVRSILVDGNRAEEFGKQSVSLDFFPLLG